MPSLSDSPGSSEFNRTNSATIEQLLAEFHASWSIERFQTMDSVLDRSTNAVRMQLLVEMILADVKRRLNPREPLVGDYLGHYPELRKDPSVAAELLAAELALRRRLAESPLTSAEFIERLPALVAQDLPALAHLPNAITPDPVSPKSPNAAESLDVTSSQASPFGTTRAPDPQSQPSDSPSRLGEYEIFEALGQGGMGIVYRARQVGLNRLVALKRIRKGELASATEVSRFFAEAEAAAALDHPGIVPIYEVGQLDSQPFFAMGFVEGTDLAKRLSTGPLAPREAAQLTRQVADAVEYAHSRGIVHRDLKPANILLDAEGRARVTDFGLAKRLNVETGQTASGGVIGTPCFAPPEQARYRPDAIGPRSDVYSLGAVLYALLTGRPPFQAASFDETIRQVVDEEPVSPRRLNASVPLDLETIALKCLEKRPEQRYSSALAVAAELNRYLAGEPILARPISRPARAFRWCKRKPVAAGLIAAATLLVLLLGIGGPVVAVREVSHSQLLEQSNRELRAANKQAETAKANAIAEANAAHRAAERSRVVLKFFTDRVLAAGRPRGQSGGLGVDTTVREALDAAEPQIRTDFVNQPEVEAVVRAALGLTFFHLGDTERATSQLERSRGLGEPVFGVDSEAADAVRRGLGEAYLAGGRIAEALPMLEKAFQSSAARHGKDQIDTLSSMNSLAKALALAGKRERAIALQSEVVRISTAKLGRDHAQTLISMSNLANMLHESGELTSSLDLYLEVQERQQKAIGIDHPDYLLTLNSIAILYQTLNRLDDSIKMLQATLKAMERVLPPDHRNLLAAKNNLASAYKNAGKIDLAMPLFSDVVNALKEKPGESRLLLISRANLADCFRAAGTPNLAIPELEDILPQANELLGPDNPETLVIAGILGGVYQQTGNHKRAIEILADVVSKQRELFGSRDLQVLRSMNNLAGSYKELKRYSEAAPLFEDVVQGTAAVLSADHPRTSIYMDNLIDCYVKMNQQPDAENWLRKLIGIQKASRDSEIRKRVPANLLLLGQCYFRQRKLSEAEQVLRELRALQGESQGSPWSIFYAKTLLGQTLLELAKNVKDNNGTLYSLRLMEAEAELVSGIEGLESRPKGILTAGTVDYVSALESTIDLFGELSRPEEASKWQRKLTAFREERSATSKP